MTWTGFFLLGMAIVMLSPTLFFLVLRDKSQIKTTSPTSTKAPASTPNRGFAKRTQVIVTEYRVLVAIGIIIIGGGLVWFGQLKLLSLLLAFYYAVTIVSRLLEKAAANKGGVLMPAIFLAICLAWFFRGVDLLHEGKLDFRSLLDWTYTSQKYLGSDFGTYTFNDHTWYQFDWKPHMCVQAYPPTGMQVDLSHKSQFIIGFKTRQGDHQAEVKELRPGETWHGYTC